MSADNDFRKIPVYIYSSSVNPDYIQKCKQNGAADFLLKPFSLAEFDQIPDRILKSMETGS